MIKAIRERFQASRSAMGSLFSFLGSGRELPHHSSFMQLADEGYRQNAIVYACVRAISQAVAEPELKALTILPDGAVHTNSPANDALARLITRPNDEHEPYEFFEKLVIHLYTVGNGFVWKIRPDVGGFPVALELLPPHLVGVIPGTTRQEGRIKSYTVDVGTHKVTLPAADVVHFRLPDAFDDLWGLSPLYVLRRQIDTDFQASEFLRSFFKNKGIPAGLLSLDGRVQKEERERVRDLWNEQFGRGADSWHKLSVIDARVTYTPLNTGIERMDLGNVTSQTETRICSVFGVPPSIISAQAGVSSARLTNTESFHKIFWLNTLAPMFTRLSRKLTADLAHREFGLDRQVVFDLSTVSTLQENRAEIRKIALQGWNAGLLTRDQSLVLLGLSNDSEGGNLVKVLPGTEFRTILNESGSAKTEDVVPTTVQNILPAEVLAILKPDHMHVEGVEEWQVVHNIADAAADDIRQAFQLFVGKAEDSLQVSLLLESLQNFDMQGAVSSVTINSNDVYAALETAITSVVQRIASSVPSFIDGSEGFIFDAEDAATELTEFLEELVARLINEQELSLRRAIEHVLSGSVPIEEGVRTVQRAFGLTSRQVDLLIEADRRMSQRNLSREDIANSLDAAQSQFLASRSKSIADTESMNAAALAQEIVWRQLRDQGIIREEEMRRFWIVTPDDRLDQAICALIPALNPDGRALNEPFDTPVGQLDRPTAHSRCRCSVAIVHRNRPRPGFDSDGNPVGISDVGQRNLRRFQSGTN